MVVATVMSMLNVSPGQMAASWLTRPWLFTLTIISIALAIPEAPVNRTTVIPRICPHFIFRSACGWRCLTCES